MQHRSESQCRRPLLCHPVLHVHRDRTPLFCDTGLAERVERVETQLIAEASRAARRRQGGSDGFVIPIAGAVATFAEPGSPFNKVAGLGFAGAPSAADLDEIEHAFADHGADVQVELSHLGDPRVGALLTDRGYRLTSFENVLGLVLDGEVEPLTPPGIEARRSGVDEFDAWLDVVADGCSLITTTFSAGRRAHAANSPDSATDTPTRARQGTTRTTPSRAHTPRPCSANARSPSATPGTHPPIRPVDHPGPPQSTT
jgi:hypothetical protein